jgi:ribose/xylose/arabinose/galactoside ABC-type transport system permease subunit
LNATDAIAPTKARRTPFSLIQSQEATLAVFLVLILAFLAIATPTFMDAQNIRDVLVNASFPAIAAIGMTLVIISAEIDISIGSILAVVAVLTGNLALTGMPIPLVFLIGLIAGTLLGALNGALVAYAGIPSIIVTLGALSFWRGLVIYITQGAWIYNMPEEFHFAQRSWFDMPIPVWMMAILILLAGLYMRFSPLGRQFYAVGGNRQAAMLAGIPIKRRLLLVLTLNGTFAAIAAMIYASRFSVVQSNAGLGFEFQVITAVVIGGTSIMGGTGSIWGSFLGALLMAVIGTGMTFLKLSPYWLQTVQGSLILLAVVSDMVRRRRMLNR